MARAQRLIEAMSMLKQALALQARLTELKFRGTEVLFLTDHPQEALAMLRDVFA